MKFTVLNEVIAIKGNVLELEGEKGEKLQVIFKNYFKHDGKYYYYLKYELQKLNLVFQQDETDESTIILLPYGELQKKLTSIFEILEILH